MADNVTITPTVQTITVTPAGGTTTTITPAATQTVTITQSASISSAIGTTDDLTEGSTNLYFTNARASAAAPVQSVTMPSGYTVTDISGDLTVSVTNAANARAGIGADNAANLYGDIAAARLANRSISDFSDVGILNKTADNIMYTDGSRVLARAPSNWNLSQFTNDLSISLDSLSDVSSSSATNGQALVYNSGTTQWEPGSVSASSLSVSQLTSGSLSISLNPDTDQAYDLGTEDFRWGTLHGDVEGSVIFRAKNANAGALAVGDVVYISGYTSGETPDVDLADANDSAKMPAFGIVSVGANSGAEVHVVTFGTLIGLDLNPATYSAGDAIYVSNTAGDFTNTPPTGESSGLQKIGVVIKPNTGGGTNGSVKVLGAGRTNAVPNLNSGNIFYGNGSNQAVPTALTSVAEAAGAVSTHAAVTSGVHGISSFGATLIDDADAAAARTTLGAAATNHNHAASNITSGTFDDARIASSNVTQHAGDINIGNLGNVTTGLLSDNMFLAYSTGSSAFTGRAPAAARTALGFSSFGSSLIDDADAAAARVTLDYAVNSPSMTGVSAGSITGIIKCSQAQYDAITPDASTLYVIV